MRRSGWLIPRPRLLERLRKGVRGPLTVVTGPPGSGKTTTVASWAADIRTRPPGTVAWVRFDDMAGSGQGLGAALSQGLAAAGTDLPTSGVEETAEALSGLDAPVVLVLDGFQPGRDAEVAEDMARLFNRAGPAMRIVLTSRADPPLPLNRYRLAGDLTEIRSADLALREAEIAAVLAGHGVRLGGTGLRSLRDRTEGWAAGVRLAAMVMQAHPAPEMVAEQFGGDDRTVVEYVRDEVLDTQSADVRRLLLVTSIAERVNAELAAGLAGDEAARAFPEMVRRNCFIIPLGHGWYRYHSMFGQALRFVLGHEAPAEARELHRRAAGWLDRAGLPTEAIRQAALAGDWSHASRLAVDRLAIGQVLGLRPDADLARCFQDMPAEVIRTGAPEPAIVAAAAAFARGHERSCASLLRSAEKVLERLPADGARTARLSAGIVHLVLSGCTDPVADAGQEPTGPAPLTEYADQPRGDRPELRALALLGQGTGCLHDGELCEASRVLGAAVTAATRAGSDLVREIGLGRLALTEALLGRFGRAARAAQTAREPSPSPFPQSSAGRRVPATHLATAWADVERGRFGGARAALERTAQMLQERPDGFVSAVLPMVRARLELAQGRPERALEVLGRAAETQVCPAWLERRLMLMASAAHSACGAGGAARTAAERAGGIRTLDSAIALTRATICDGDAVAAAATLRPTLAGSASAPIDLRVDAWLLDSYLSYRSGDGSRGRRSLDHALRLAGREQISLPFTLAKEWLRPVLRQDPELSGPYRGLLEPAMLVAEPENRGTGGTEEPAAVERLSAREVDVLRNLAQLMTTEEIATELCLSLNTVKTHLKNIYRKLGVTRRGEAVRRARHLKLL